MRNMIIKFRRTVLNLIIYERNKEYTCTFVYYVCGVHDMTYVNIRYTCKNLYVVMFKQIDTSLLTDNIDIIHISSLDGIIRGTH